MRNLIILLFCLIFGNSGYAQETTLLKILNRELRKDVKNQLKSSNFNGDTIQIIQPFSIDDQKTLSFQIKKTSPYFNGVQIIKQEIRIMDIKRMGKDINILLESNPGGVTTTTHTYVDGEVKEENAQGNLFFLYLSNEKDNEALGNQLQRVFHKAGITVAKEYWYD